MQENGQAAQVAPTTLTYVMGVNKKKKFRVYLSYSHMLWVLMLKTSYSYISKVIETVARGRESRLSGRVVMALWFNRIIQP